MCYALGKSFHMCWCPLSERPLSRIEQEEAAVGAAIINRLSPELSQKMSNLQTISTMLHLIQPNNGSICMWDVAFDQIKMSFGRGIYKTGPATTPLIFYFPWLWRCLPGFCT